VGRRTEFVEVSAKQKTGIEKLLETLLLVADLRELKANPDAPQPAPCWNRAVDKGRGPVRRSWCRTELCGLVILYCGTVFGKVRAMFDDHGRTVKDAPPSTPGKFWVAGRARGGRYFQVTDEAKARHIVDTGKASTRRGNGRTSGARITLDQLA